MISEKTFTLITNIETNNYNILFIKGAEKMNNNYEIKKYEDNSDVADMENPAVTPQDDNAGYEVIDGIKHCTVCHEPVEVYLKREILGRKTMPRECKCRREKREETEKMEALEKHKKIVEENAKECFSQSAMREWNFENDTVHSDSVKFFNNYVSNWNKMQENNAGLLIVGNVGIGKTYMAACIANALLEQEVTVKMTNFGTILDDLYKEDDKTEYIRELCRNDLLIIDDLNTERDTTFAKESIFKVIDERYRQGKPIIITTNLPVDDIKTETRIDLKRIYDRVLEMCIPIRMDGESIRLQRRKSKQKAVKQLITGEVEGC